MNLPSGIFAMSILSIFPIIETVFPLSNFISIGGYFESLSLSNFTSVPSTLNLLFLSVCIIYFSEIVITLFNLWTKTLYFAVWLNFDAFSNFSLTIFSTNFSISFSSILSIFLSSLFSIFPSFSKSWFSLLKNSSITSCINEPVSIVFISSFSFSFIFSPYFK